MYAYSIYGLRLGTTRALPGLPKAPDATGIDLHIHLNTAWPLNVEPVGAPRWLIAPVSDPLDDADGVQAWTVGSGRGAYWRFSYPSEHTRIDFLLDGEGANVWAFWSDAAPFSDVAAYLTGPVLGRVLRLRGSTCLHASVVAMGDHAIAIAGGRGAGKSTTAAGLAAAGCAVLSDDVAVLEEQGTSFRVHPGCARMRLWNPAIAALYGSRDALPRVVSNRNKRFIDLDVGHPDAAWRFRPIPLPLAAVYVLGPRTAALALPTIRPLTQAEALVALTAQSYAREILTAEQRTREFAVLAKLARSVPVRRIDRPDRIDTLPQLCQAIRDSAGSRPTGLD